MNKILSIFKNYKLKSFWQQPLTLANKLHLFILATLYFFIYYFAFSNRWLSFWPLTLIALITFLFALWLFKKLEPAIFITLILAELAWALSFLPIGPFSLVGILIISYFAINKILAKKNLKKVFIFFIIALGFILLTSHWN